jgi:preprotein translocase subunit SecF
MVIPFFKYRRIYYIFSLVLFLTLLVSLFIFKLNFGIEFKGGSILELEFSQKRPDTKSISEKLSQLNLREVMVQPVGEKGVILRMGEIDNRTHQKILESLKSFGELKEVQFESIGPTISKELKEKSVSLVILSISAIVLYMVFAFRTLSPTIPTIKCATVVLLCLCHDVILPLSLAAVLKIQISIPVVIALLTIVGYSINNVVVVYDRFRENFQKFPKKPLSQLIDEAISQTLSRQINTSLTTLFPLFSIFFLVGEDLKDFSLILILGILFGLYSSIFLALTLLGSWQLTGILKKSRIKK